MKHFLFFIFFSVVCFSALAQDTIEVKKVEYPKDYTANIDVVYATVGYWQGKVDIYFNLLATKPTPVVINIHGGGWNHGNKESQTGFKSFFKNGFAVANMAYRLVQVATAPAAIEDVRSVIAYLKKNAKQLNIDPEKIVIMGGSAGAHLALMGGLLGNDNRFDKNCEKVVDMRVAAIIDKYGPVDFNSTRDNFYKYKSLVRWLGDNADNTDFRAAVSPMTYVTKSSPPIFIVHGNADPIVPYQQSVDLYEKLKTVGVVAKFITVEEGLHGKFPKEKNSEINKEIINFLKQIKVID
jgi:acetyl esterase/lipase